MSSMLSLAHITRVPVNENTSSRTRPVLDRPEELQHLPDGLLDALMRFAIDPAQWDRFAKELDARGQALAQTDPTAFLAALSQAESLSWELRSEPRPAVSGCVYFLLGENNKVIEHNLLTDSISEYCHIDQQILRFSDPGSTENFNQALTQLQQDDHRQVLVELVAENSASRYGYLVIAEYLPAALLSDNDAQHTELQYGLLIADNESREQSRRVMQASFRLTTAETAICQRLGAGLQLKEIASQLGISTNTARNHLQSVFDKTGINRQSDLILMMTQLSVIMAVMGSSEAQRQNQQSYHGHNFTIVAQPGEAPRRIAYRRYGNGGRTIVYCHESAGTSRLPPGTASLADQLGLSIIAPERPGSGFSDPLDHYNFNHTAADIAHLLQDLNIHEFHLLGYLSGAGHALAAAALIANNPELARRHSVSSITLVSGRAPAPFPPAEQSALAVLRRRLVEQPWLLATFFNIVKNRATRTLVRRVIMSIYGANPNDRIFLQNNPDILDHIVGSALENLTVSGAGIVGEIRCFSNASAVALENISAPVSLWHGGQDSLADADAMALSVASLSYTQKRFPQAGSTLLYEKWPEILQEISDL